MVSEKIAIRVQCGDKELSFANGSFNGDNEMYEAAMFAIENKMIAGLWGVYVECSLDNLLGILGAMTMFSPSTAVVLELPKSTLKELSEMIPNVFNEGVIPADPVNTTVLPFFD